MPAQTTTSGVSIEPRSVRTARTDPARMSKPVTVVRGTRLAPRAAAARRSAAVARSGLPTPSAGQ